MISSSLKHYFLNLITYIQRILTNLLIGSGFLTIPEISNFITSRAKKLTSCENPLHFTAYTVFGNVESSDFCFSKHKDLDMVGDEVSKYNGFDTIVGGKLSK